MVGPGRHPHRARLPAPLRRGRDQGRRRRRSTCPTRSATPIRANTPTCSATLIENVPGADTVIFSTHCHNDLGLAVANSLAGVAGRRAAGRVRDQRHRRAGRQRGAGRDRHGAEGARRHACPSTPASSTQHITRASRYVSAITGFPVQFNKAIVGKNAFAHESGIHQDGMLKNREHLRDHAARRTSGQGASNLVMGKHSGRHAFREKLKDLGYELGQNALNEASSALQGPGRQEEARLRRRHRRPGRRRPGLAAPTASRSSTCG